PFLISLLHDLTGFRVENVFALNVSLALVTLSATYWMVHTMVARTAPALFAVALVSTLPLFGQNATGAGMEMLNLAMIALNMVAATRYLQKPAADGLAFLVLGTVLLAETRYESVLFVLPVACVILIGWIRAREVLLPWPVMIAPLLLV